jgi:hypothetical protein
MSSSLPAARDAFIAAIKKDTPGSDLPRFVAVLDALIAWSVARPDQLAFRADGARNAVVGFSRAGSKGAFWSAQVTRGTGPKLEISSPMGSALSDEERATVLETLNAHSRVALEEGDRLRIGFGALKNAAAQAAVLALMERLLVDSGQPAASSPE